jgi:hypothetical protein
VGGSGLIRDILDFDAWLQGSSVGPGVRLDSAREAFWEVVRETGQGKQSLHGERTLYIPTSYRNPRKSVFVSPAMEGPLPSCIPPLSEPNEQKIIFAMMEDLNLYFGVGVDPTPSLERGVVTQEADSEAARVVLVGASHMTRLAESMGPETVSLAYQGFRPMEPMIADLLNKLRSLRLTSRDTVVLDLLSNCAFMGTDTSGLPTEAVRAEDGRYHIVGSLSVAPVSCAKKVLQTCLPLADAIRDTGVVLLSPVPRYMHTKCCDDPSHIENFDDKDIDSEIAEGLEAFKRVLQNWGTENELMFTIIDPTMLNDTCDLPIKSRVTEDGQPLWSPMDPVHMTCAAYRDLATVIKDTAQAIDPADSASAAGSCAGHLRKRRAESVVTMPPANARKKLRGSTKIRVAGWLLGRSEAPAQSTRGGSYRASWRGARSAGTGPSYRARGGWHRSPPSYSRRGGGWRRW